MHEVGVGPLGCMFLSDQPVVRLRLILNTLTMVYARQRRRLIRAVGPPVGGNALYVTWIGPNRHSTRIEYHDAWVYLSSGYIGRLQSHVRCTRDSAILS